MRGILLCRDLVQRRTASSASGAVQRQLQLGNVDLASANLAKEGEIAELRNQIAIIRWATLPEFVHPQASGMVGKCWSTSISKLKSSGSTALRMSIIKCSRGAAAVVASAAHTHLAHVPQVI